MIRLVDQFYKELSEGNLDAFIFLWAIRYLEELMYLYNRRYVPREKEDSVEELLEMYLMGLFDEKPNLSDESELINLEKIPKSSRIYKKASKEVTKIISVPNSVTQVVYETEILRKRDRAKEAVLSTIGIRNKQIQMDRELIQWTRFTGWYSDIIEESACETAIIDSGVSYVRWVTSKDDKVCGECEELEGKVFKVQDIPEHPHRNCRCTVTPVRR